MMQTPPPNENTYARLDVYLMSVFQLLEGIADLEEAERGIRKVLDSPHCENLEPNLEELLYELYFAKCRKYFEKSAE